METKLKQCSYCKEFKSINEFGKYTYAKDGLSYSCKKCRHKISIKCAQKRRSTFRDPKTQSILYQQGLKRCTSCEVIEPLDQFYLNKTHIKRRDYHKSRCKSCEINDKRKYYPELRRTLIEMLGGWQCGNPYCPIPKEKLDYRCLDIEHIYNNGNQDRKRFSSPRTMLLYYINNPEVAKNTLRVWCAYCNRLRRFLDGDLKESLDIVSRQPHAPLISE